MTNIKFLYDESGHQQAYEFLLYLNEEAKQDSEKEKLLGLIMQGLEDLESANLFPVGTADPYVTTLKLQLNSSGQTIIRTLELVKPLDGGPVLEMRVDWSGIGWFRATYFPFQYNDQNYYCFVKAFIKTRNPPYNPTNIARDETLRIFQKVLDNPERYL